MACTKKREDDDLPIARSMNAPTEICDFQLSVDADKKVFRFDVAMNDVFRMEVGESLSDLSYILPFD